MIYRGPGFLAVVWFCSSPTSSPPLPLESCLSFSVSCLSSWDWWELTDGRGGEGVGEGGAKSYDCENAWLCINHSILSAPDHKTNFARTWYNVHPTAGEPTNGWVYKRVRLQTGASTNRRVYKRVRIQTGEPTIGNAHAHYRCGCNWVLLHLVAPATECAC